MKYGIELVLVVGLLASQGCVGPATQALHKKSLRFDPPPTCYYGAWQTDKQVIISYQVESTTSVLSTRYWACVSNDELSGRNFSGWKIMRTKIPIEMSNPTIRPIPIIDISTNVPPTNKHFLNKDQYLTYIIDSQHIPLPALLCDTTNMKFYFNSFYLESTNMLYGSYRGIWNAPHGTFRDYKTVAKNSWKYPFCMLADIVLYPFDKWLEYVLRDLT